MEKVRECGLMGSREERVREWKIQVEDPFVMPDVANSGFRRIVVAC